MHTVVMGTDPEGRQVDHRNGNGLDNQRGNLRWATMAEQRANMGRYTKSLSGFKGVHLDRRTGQWIAQLTHQYRKHYLGVFASPEAAAKAYDNKASELFGDFARLNFPTSGQA
jgi:hypothetical protein